MNKKFEVNVLDATWNWDDSRTVAEKILSASASYDLLGFSVNRSNFSGTIETIKIVRDHGFHGHVTLGGFFPTFHFTKILQNFAEVDSIILGHGEYTLVALCHALSLGKSTRDIPGLAYRGDHNKILFSNCYENEDFIRTLGIPIHRPRYGVARMVTSRGCSKRCTFCCISVFDKYNFKNKYLRRNLYELFEEIDLLVDKYSVSHIWLSDMDFIGKDHHFITEFCEEIVKRNYKITFEGDCRLDSLNESLIRKLAEAGFKCLFVGVESFSERQLEDYCKYKRNFNKNDIFKTVALLKKYGIIARFGFIMFDKDSTLEELILNHETIFSTVGYGTLDGLANKLALLPGTKIESEYLKDSENCYQVEINRENRLNSHLYYTQYKFRDGRVKFVYDISFSYRNKFHRLQELFDNRLKTGGYQYNQHARILWRLRDKFGRIYEAILHLALKDGSAAVFSENLRGQLDEILIDFCTKQGFPRETVKAILDEENRNPGEKHP